MKAGAFKSQAKKEVIMITSFAFAASTLLEHEGLVFQSAELSAQQ